VKHPIPALPADGYEGYVIGYIKEAIEEGDAFLKAQEGYEKIQPTMNAIMSVDDELRPSSLASTKSNQIGKIAGDLAALLTDIRPFWEYRTFNRKFDKASMIMGKLSLHWYLQTAADVRLAEVVKYYEAGATGWGHLFWDMKEQDIGLTGEDPRDFLPIRPKSTTTIQDAAGCILRRACTVNDLRAEYPRKAHLIQADRDGSMVNANSGTSRVARFVESLGSPFWAYMERNGVKRKVPRIPTCDKYVIYLDDDSRHESVMPAYVGEFNERGEPANNWSYIVEKGDLLYPRKRCIVATNTAILYDGPNHYWHAMYPFPRLTLDPWPWSWLGKAPLWDLLPLQNSYDRTLRVIDDNLAKIAQPDIIADKNSVSRAALDKINTRAAGLKFMQNPLAGKGIQIVPPPQLPAEVRMQVAFLKEEMRELSGLSDMSQLLRLNQLPSADSIDKMIQSMTPLVRSRSRMFEAFMREFATMLSYNFAQFYTLPMRLKILGEDGVTPEDFDFDPGSMIPDFVHEQDFDRDGNIRPEALVRGPLPRYDRAREALRQFTFHVAPGSLLSASEIERKLMYLQFFRAGIIDMWTLADVWNIPNMGSPPQGANTIPERLRAQQQMGIGETVSPAGRKASGQELPRIAIKES